MIERPEYVKRLVSAMGNGMVKIITGVRRCGKSYLLSTLFRDRLRDMGVDDAHVHSASLDLKAGQAIDRVGVSLGIPFPCGPEMERLALSFRGKGFYRHKVSVNGTFCSFSGLENIATNLNKQGKDNSEICYFIFDYITN